MPPLAPELVTTLAKASLTGLTIPKGVSRESLHPPIETLTKAVCSAWAIWQSSLTLVGVVINGPVASGGKLIGPPIEPLIRANLPPGFKQFVEPVARGLDQQLQLFCATVTVPGLPWYPSFAAMPGSAPPTPNVPCPLLVIAGGAANLLSRTNLMQAMFTRLPLPRPNGSEQVCAAISAGIEAAVQPWLASTMVTMVLGSGPVPAYSPPYVPVAPVVGGVGNQVPGGMT